MAPALILGSSSPYRAELLARLGLPFTQEAPAVDESPRPGEAPADLARRLARSKAAAVAARHPAAWVLASDQVAALDDRELLAKPGDRAGAERQLRASAARTVVFHTAACLRRGAARSDVLDRTVVHFRQLDEPSIARYLDREEPFDCAGSFKAEGLGITLFTAIETRDPTAIVGLPLIAVAELLRRAGFSLP